MFHTVKETYSDEKSLLKIETNKTKQNKTKRHPSSKTKQSRRLIQFTFREEREG